MGHRLQVEMKIKRKRKHSLKYVFVKYFIFVISSFISALFIFILFGNVIIKLGVVQDPYVLEKNEELLKSEIEKNADFDFSKLPSEALYALIKNDEIFESNMTKKEQKEALYIYFSKLSGEEIPIFYNVIERKEDICILLYEPKIRYTIPWMEKFLPDFEVLILFLLAITCIAEFVLLTLLFSRKLKKRLSSIIELTEKIKEQDLDFQAKRTDITELNDVIDSIDSMKEALKESLIKNWNMEQTKREQIEALAHDIKTPLTVIRGNTELLSLTELTDRQKDFVNYSLNNIDRVELLLKNLSELNKGKNIDRDLHEVLATDKFITQISEEIKALAIAKSRSIDIINKLYANIYINVDIDLLNRAVMNIVSNAINYSKEDTDIEVNFSIEDGKFLIKCIDKGKGFNKEELKKAKEQFYRGDKSRTNTEHSGLGLSIADDIVSSFGGELRLENNIDVGASVSILIPIADI